MLNIGQIDISFTVLQYMWLKLHNSVKRWKIVQQQELHKWRHHTPMASNKM